MIPVSVIVITKNEENNIIGCLESVRWADDIVLVDAQSIDKTVECARLYTSKIFIQPWLGFAEAKKFAVERTAYDWVLWIDADERVVPELANEIQSIVQKETDIAAFTVGRKAYFLGRWIRHSGWYPGRVARLFHKRRARFNSAAVHEGLEIDGPIGRLRYDLLHFTDPNLYHYFGKFNRYTALASQESVRKGKKFHFSDILVRPPWLFVKMYFLRLGFLDGVPGLLLALLSSAYVFTKYAKIWESQTGNNLYI